MTTVLLVFFGFTFISVAAVLIWYTSREQEPSEVSVLAAPAAQPSEDLVTQAFRVVGERVQGPEKPGGTLRRDLQKAGYRSQNGVAVFLGVRIAVAVALASMLGFLALLNQGDASATLTAAFGGAGLGYMVPDRVLRFKIRSRANRIRRAIPAALDLLVLGIEAGQSLNQALLDTAAEIRDVFPELAVELTQVHLELRAGKARSEALYQLGDRTGEPELRKLANVLIDADRFGTSLGPALRSHARYLRVRMRQQAQEAARKVGVRLVFPVFFLIFPSVLLVTLAPAVMKMAQQFQVFLAE